MFAFLRVQEPHIRKLLELLVGVATLKHKMFELIDDIIDVEADRVTTQPYCWGSWCNLLQVPMDHHVALINITSAFKWEARP